METAPNTTLGHADLHALLTTDTRRYAPMYLVVRGDDHGLAQLATASHEVTAKLKLEKDSLPFPEDGMVGLVDQTHGTVWFYEGMLAAINLNYTVRGGTNPLPKNTLVDPKHWRQSARRARVSKLRQLK